MYLSVGYNIIFKVNIKQFYTDFYQLKKKIGRLTFIKNL